MLFYNATVALPVSLSLIKDRLEQSYYRQTQGFLGDVDTLVNNARDFNGDDSPVGLAAAGDSFSRFGTLQCCIITKPQPWLNKAKPAL